MLFAALLLLSVVTVSAWVNPDCTENEFWEGFGPRVDRVLIKLYASDTAEFTALEGHEIDICDWPLTLEFREKLCTPPESDYLKCVSYGPDYGFRILDINNNETTGGNPCVTREAAMRLAIAHLVDKPLLVDTCVGGAGFPLWTVVGPGWTKYSHPDIRPGGLLEELAHLYSCEDARQVIIDAPNFQFVAGPAPCPPPCTGEIESDYGDHLEWYVPETDTWEVVCIDFFIRADDPERECAGNIIADEIEHCLGACVNRVYGDSTAGYLKVMVAKDFNLYTGGWSLSFDPDWLYYLYHIDYYWHPGFCYNYGKIDCPEFNTWSRALVMPNTQAEAVESCHKAQEAMHGPDCVGMIPLWEAEGTHAYRTTYLGSPGVPDGEDMYEGQNWLGVVNEDGLGLNSFWTLQNMHPEGYEWGDCENMTIRYGFRVPDMRLLNPLYASWYYDWNVLSECYDSLLATNPYDAGQWLSYIATWGEETYINPTYGECDKFTFYIRDDISWCDGTPFTIADVDYVYNPGPTGVYQQLKAKGCPDPWFRPNIADINSTVILDPYTIEVYMNTKSLWNLHQVGGCVMFPKHIWEPVITDPLNDCAFIQSGDADPNLIGTGPFKFVEYVSGSYILLEKSPHYFRRCDLPPDVNWDGDVDVFDAVLVRKHFGHIPLSCTEPAESPYFECYAADINKDSVVDVFDAVEIRLHFGATC
jgi:ABC-type transport system substrate-binding protein